MRRVFVLLGLLGCGGSAMTIDGGPRIECDPAAQNCPAGQTCDVICDAVGTKVGCRPAGTLPAGSACTAVESCAAKTGCFVSVGVGQTCVRYCNTNADCAQGTCQERMVFRTCLVESPRFMVKFCLP